MFYPLAAWWSDELLACYGRDCVILIYLRASSENNVGLINPRLNQMLNIPINICTAASSGRLFPHPLSHVRIKGRNSICLKYICMVLVKMKWWTIALANNLILPFQVHILWHINGIYLYGIFENRNSLWLTQISHCRFHMNGLKQHLHETFLYGTYHWKEKLIAALISNFIFPVYMHGL